MTDPPPPDSDAPERVYKALRHLSVEIAELRQLLAALVIVLSDDSGSSEIHDSGDALAHWAMQEFDFEILAETLGDFLPEQRSDDAPPAEMQHELFPQQLGHVDPD